MATKDKTSTAIVPATTYAILQADTPDIRETIAENLGGRISISDLDQVKVPGAGGTTWEIPTLEGTEESKELTGIIVLAQDTRSYWPDEYSGGNTPPSCFSSDGLTGKGDPGGDCSTCPFAQFGSAARGEGQACKQQNVLFVVRPDSLLPAVLRLPPTSLRAFRQYAARLAARGVKLGDVVTTLTLETDKNASGIKYSKVSATFTRRLEGEELAFAKRYATGIRPALTQIASAPIVEASDEDEDEGGMETIDVPGEIANDDFDSLGRSA